MVGMWWGWGGTDYAESHRLYSGREKSLESLRHDLTFKTFLNVINITFKVAISSVQFSGIKYILTWARKDDGDLQ